MSLIVIKEMQEKKAQTDRTSTPTTANEQTLGKFSDRELTTRKKN